MQYLHDSKLQIESKHKAVHVKFRTQLIIAVYIYEKIALVLALIVFSPR